MIAQSQRIILRNLFLLATPFVVFVLIAAKSWYLPQSYYNGASHFELIRILAACLCIYVASVFVILKLPLPMLATVVWFYLIFIASKNGLFLNEVHLFKSAHSNSLLLYGLSVCASVVVIAGLVIPRLRHLHLVQIITKSILLFPLVVIIFQFSRKLIGLNEGLSLATKLAIMIAAVFISIILAKFSLNFAWKKVVRHPLVIRLITAIFTGLLIYSSTALLPSPLFTKSAEYTVLDFQGIHEINPRSKKVLFLLLDELSPEYVGPVLATIVESKIPYQMEIITATSHSTLNAIPSLLTGHRYKDMLPCGVSTICSGQEKLDFEKLRSKSLNVDVIGMWHPYCSIKDLRSCYTRSAFHETPAVDLFCKVFNHVPGDLDIILRTCVVDAGLRDNNLADILQKAFRMPFWQKGGELFMHLPIPHPAMEESLETRQAINLLDHYKKNVVHASVIVHDILNRLRQTFGDDFTLIITSDHPLRLDLWCGNHYSCDTRQTVRTGEVPFIVVSPTLSADTLLPKDQLQIFTHQ